MNIQSIFDRMVEGDKISANNIEYIYDKGVLRQLSVYSNNQNQTKDAFGYKWKQIDTYNSENVKKSFREWFMLKYFDNDIEKMRNTFEGRKYFLDAGCGSGFSALTCLKPYLNNMHYYGVDISEAIDIAKENFDKEGIKGIFVQADILSLPFEYKSFDIVFSEGVLHHTDSTYQSIKYLSNLIKDNGAFIFYVYKKKSPIREFCDDFIREKLKTMSPEEAWENMYSLSKFGKVLGEKNVVLDIPEEINLLGIPKGKIDLQELFYYHIFKCFYKKEFSLEEINHTNYDWYAPANCHRHTEEEIRKWCDECGMDICRLFVDGSGISVIAKKRKED